MSLTHVRGPLGSEPSGSSSPPLPAGGTTYVEPHPRRIRAVAGGVTVIDTERALLVHRPGTTLAYAFPTDEVGDLPTEPAPLSPGHVLVPWDAVDSWFEEGRELVHYPPNPYHRVDCRAGTRRLRVEVRGVVVVDAERTTAVFETGLAPRLYVEPSLARTDLLRRSATTSYCNYKGHATWWDAVVDGLVVPDVAWSYEDPLPESAQIAGFLCFDDDRVRVSAELPA